MTDGICGPQALDNARQPAVGRSASGQGDVPGAHKVTGVSAPDGQVSFGQTLEVEFSRHASERMRQRDIRLQPGDLDKIGQAVGKAAGRGSKDALLLLRDLGLVVNVKNRKVLTAIDAERLQNRVFTNIDSTVIIKD